MNLYTDLWFYIIILFIAAFDIFFKFEMVLKSQAKKSKVK